MKRFIAVAVIITVAFMSGYMLFAQDSSSMTQTTTSTTTTQQTTTTTTTQQPVTSTNQENNPVKFTPTVFEANSVTYMPEGAVFGIKAEDTGSGVSAIEYSVDDKGYVAYKDPIAFTVEGYHTVTYRVIDNVGNVSYSKTVNICLDKSAPEMQLIPSSFVYENKGLSFIPANYSFIIKANDKYSGTKSIFYSINDEQFQEYKDKILFDKGGTYTIKYYSVDNVGNASQIYVYQFIVDAEKPVAQIVPSDKFTLIGDKNYAALTTTYTVKALDAMSGVKIVLVSVDGGDFVPYVGPITLTTEGSHTISVQVIDNVNNTSEEVKLTVIVDNTPPTASAQVVIPATAPAK